MKVLCFALFACAYNLLLCYVGLVSFGHAAFLGAACYVSAHSAKVWGFPPELYLPIFRFCREFGIRMIALNCYRALVTRVGKEGWDAIAEEDRDGLTPAKPATRAYRDYLFSLVSGPDGIFQTQSEEAEARKDRFTRAQQTWDRAFACNIAATQTGDALENAGDMAENAGDRAESALN